MMKLITRDTDYAVRALRFVAKKKEGVIPVSLLAKELKVPRPFLRRILQILDKRKLVKSYKGKGGGFKLNKRPEEIFLIDLIRIFQGPLRISEHVLRNKVCPDIKKCKLKVKLDGVEACLFAKLKDINLKSIL